MKINKIKLFLFHAFYSIFAVAFAADDTQKLLDEIGTWDGVTEQAALSGPYEDPAQANVNFGKRSYYLTPWRAYMDTHPAAQFLNSIGSSFNSITAAEADPVAKIISENGFHSIRVEIGPGKFDYDDPTQMTSRPLERVTAQLKALKKYNLRPLILLNANHGNPVPKKISRVKLLSDAQSGDRTIRVNSTDNIKPFYSGLTKQARRNCFPRIVSVEKSPDGKSWICQLSAPLEKPLQAGNLKIVTQKYQPFSGTVFSDGTPNPAAQETVRGWLTYVDAVCRIAKEVLGTEGADDAGFDIEVWNEYTFGSEFLKEKNYYEPDRSFSQQLIYRNKGREKTGHEIILPITVDYVTDPKNNCPGVNVISGFASQRPWDNGAGRWPGQAGLGGHPYSSVDPWPKWSKNQGLLSPHTIGGRTIEKPSGKKIKQRAHEAKQFLDALGQQETESSFFTPTFRVGQPEANSYAINTTFIIRNLQPFPSPWTGYRNRHFERHHRFSHPGNGTPNQTWLTEVNLGRGDWSDWLIQEKGVNAEDPKLRQLMLELAAKATLRSFIFLSHKGVDTVNLFTLKFHKKGDFRLSIIPEAFFTKLKEADYQLTHEVRAEVGAQVETIGRVANWMKAGQPLENTRALRVEELVEYKPRLVFRGDGTEAHPDRFHRDDFAFFPYQLSDRKYLVAYYVATRSMIHSWDKSKELLDPTRYEMPEQTFRLRLSNVLGSGAQVSAKDALTNEAVDVKVISGTGNELEVEIKAVDYPRFLIIEEKETGPLIEQVKTKPSKEEGGLHLSFTPNISGQAKIQWGPFPERKGNEKSLRVSGRKTETLHLPNFTTADGLRIVLESGKLKTEWPRWDWDTRGRIYNEQTLADFSKTFEGKDSVINLVDSFPELSKGPKPKSFSIAPSYSSLWQKEGGRLVYKKEDGSLASLEQKVCQPADIEDYLPAFSTIDNYSVKATTWGGHPAWEISIQLEQLAHPSEKQLERLVYVVPTQSGVIMLQFAATSGFVEEQFNLSRMLESVSFE